MSSSSSSSHHLSIAEPHPPPSMASSTSSSASATSSADPLLRTPRTTCVASSALAARLQAPRAAWSVSSVPTACYGILLLSPLSLPGLGPCRSGGWRRRAPGGASLAVALNRRIRSRSPAAALQPRIYRRSPPAQWSRVRPAKQSGVPSRGDSRGVKKKPR